MLTAMVFSGGLGLASYHAGVYQTFPERGLPLHWVSGSSAGAITAAQVAGNPVEQRVGRLESYWQMSADAPVIDHPFRRLQAGTSGAWGTLRDIRASSGCGYPPRIPYIFAASMIWRPCGSGLDR